MSELLDIALVNGMPSILRGESITSYVPINEQTGTTYTLQESDCGKIVTLNNAAGITVTVPSKLPLGYSVVLMQIGAGQVTISASGTTINNKDTQTKISGQHGVVSLIQYASETYNLSGATGA